jgi:hypothetical protein
MPITITLPAPGGRLERHTLSSPGPYPDTVSEPLDRLVYAAPHVVADPLAGSEGSGAGPIDWDATIAVRRRLWALGLGVAEAMEPAQRRSGLDWAAALALLGRSLNAAQGQPGARIVCGCGTDHLAPGDRLTVADVIDAYVQQAEAIERLGGRLALMASDALAACARSPDQYALVYDRLLAQVREPVVLVVPDGVGDPALAGYWGSEDRDEAIEVMLAVVRRHPAKVEGVALSPADPIQALALRRRLPAGVGLFTTDECDFTDAIAGDATGHADALLGVMDAIAPAAGAALAARARGEHDRYRAILAPTLPLARHLFCAPTRSGATGVVFLAWLNAEQRAFAMLDGRQSARGILHLVQAFRLADAAGLLRDPEQACARMRSLLAVHGIDG